MQKGHMVFIPTPPQLPALPNFGSPYFKEFRNEIESEATSNNLQFRFKSINRINFRSELVEHLISNGMYAIPTTDPPLLFNKFLATQRGIIGAEHVAQVICQDNPDFETYLCRSCEYWNTPGAMITHLKSEKHQLNHMRKKFKDQFHKIQVARKRNRQGLIDQYVKYISLVEIPKIEKRTKAALNVEILLKIWPKFLQEFDDSWKNFEDDDKNDKEIEVITIDDDSDTEVEQRNFSGSSVRQKPVVSFRTPKIEEVEAISSPSSLSINPPNFEMEIEEGEIISSPEIMNACVYALVFIRAIVIAKEKVEKNKVEQICKLFRVTSEMVFSDEILEYAGNTIGNVEILVVIAEHWKQGISLSTLLKKVAETTPSPSPPPTSTVLLELGLDKAKVAKLIRDVDIILHTEIEREVNPSTVFTRKYSKRHLVHHFDRSMILYDGDYIEAPKNFENGSTSKKHRNF